MHPNPLGLLEKKLILFKNTKNMPYVQSLGKKPHLGTYTETKKCVARSQVR